MRAAVWEGPGEMSVGEVPDATCPPDGVLALTGGEDGHSKR